MIAARDVATFAEDGAIVLRGLLGEWVEPLRRGIERNAAEPGPYGVVGGGPFKGYLCQTSRCVMVSSVSHWRCVTVMPTPSNLRWPILAPVELGSRPRLTLTLRSVASVVGTRPS